MPHLLFLACALLSSAEPPANPPAPAGHRALDVVAALETALADAIAKAEPSVVAIAREKSTTGDETTAVRGRNPAGRPARPRSCRATSTRSAMTSISFDYGSGVVIGERGEILTAYHVVKGASRLVVRAFGQAAVRRRDHRRRPAQRPGRDRPPAGPGRRAARAQAAGHGRRDQAPQGAFLVALGNPFNAARDGRPLGQLGHPVQRRPPPRTAARGPDAGASARCRIYPTLLQLDAKLNLGMSGGAVINLKGELVGLTTAAANAAGFDAQAGYAIPMDALGRRLVETLRQGKEFEYGFLGIRLDTAG